jgi:MFS-type transporter involved in bile tolerance (Atg22 family)
VSTSTLPAAVRPGLTAEHRRVIVGAALGSVFEWYDFFLYGSLAAIIAARFFAKADPATGLIFALLAFSAGFIVRPFGAVVFGTLGDRIGRKYTFLATILLMGFATFGVGLLPGYDSIGIAAPVILITLRLVQGLATGGEYGGANIYVAEHAPPGHRGVATAWIQVTGTLGFVLSLLVILATRLATGEAAFAAWGWRIPFLVSVLLLGLSLWIRLSMAESPVFKAMKAENRASHSPLRESFGSWRNTKMVLQALFGLVAGFGVVWYTTQFYVLLFLTQTLKVDGVTANILVVVAITLASPFFVVFGAVSDRIGRKWLVLAGIAAAALSFFPIFGALTHYANPALERALHQSPVVVRADPADCQFQFNPTGTKTFTSSCDIAKARLVAASVNYRNQAAPAGSVAEVHIGGTVVPSFNRAGLSPAEVAARTAAFARDLTAAITAAGYPAHADPAAINKPAVVGLIFLLVFLLAVAYGPVAALLIELFPARIRYTSLSVPYHLGTGWFGGLTPAIAFAMVAYQGDIYFGLWFPAIVALVTVVIGAFCIPDRRNVDLSL